jgi:hypothetical protein
VSGDGIAAGSNVPAGDITAPAVDAIAAGEPSLAPEGSEARMGAGEPAAEVPDRSLPAGAAVGVLREEDDAGEEACNRSARVERGDGR